MTKQTGIRTRRHQPSPYRCVECGGQVTLINKAKFALHNESGDVIGEIRAECVVYCLNPVCGCVRIRLSPKADRYGVSATSSRVLIVARGERLYDIQTQPTPVIAWNVGAVSRTAAIPLSAANNP